MNGATLNATHDAAARSWWEPANGHPDFPVQNLPYARGRRRDGGGSVQSTWIALGDHALDLSAWVHSLRGLPVEAPGLAWQAAQAAARDLRDLMRMGPHAWHLLRAALFSAFRVDATAAARDSVLAHLVDQTLIAFDTPVHIGEYTDFYTSLHHARNVGQAIGNGGLVSPNFFWMPIAYHGRASSLGVGQSVRRPFGQSMPPGADQPVYGPCQRLDFELEMAIYIGGDNALGAPVPIAQAESHVFGMGLLNDWSARDIQFWEMAPLGPFLGKNFATTLSPWIVTMEALAPFRLPFHRDAQYPQPLPYLDSPAIRASGAFDVQLRVSMQTAAMRQSGRAAQEISRANFRDQHWCVAQMVVQHTVGGCNLRAGDVLGSGTVSGPSLSQAGAIIELTQAGRVPIAVGDGERRAFVEDGDRVVLQGWCERPGAVRIGFGRCEGEVLPALIS